MTTASAAPCEAARERVEAHGVDELAARETHGPHDHGVRVRRRDADNRVAGPDEHLHGRDDRRGEPVGDEDVVAAGLAAEVLERELRQPLAEERRREVVVEQLRLGVDRR